MVFEPHSVKILSGKHNLRLIVVFSVAFSLGILTGPASSNFHLPAIQLARATLAPVEKWYPSGPAMDTELVLIFTDQVAEFTDLQSATPHIDLTDEPILPCPPILDLCGANGGNFFITSSVSLHRYYDIQFMLVNNFWVCDFNFGNSNCGVQTRQGIAHLIDKAKFAASEPSLAGLATSLDNPLPPKNGGLLPPNPCSWDTSFPQSGSNSVVRSPGGTAYHRANP